MIKLLIWTHRKTTRMLNLICMFNLKLYRVIVKNVTEMHQLLLTRFLKCIFSNQPTCTSNQTLFSRYIDKSGFKNNTIQQCWFLHDTCIIRYDINMIKHDSVFNSNVDLLDLRIQRIIYKAIIRETRGLSPILCLLTLSQLAELFSFSWIIYALFQ